MRTSFVNGPLADYGDSQLMKSRREGAGVPGNHIEWTVSLPSGLLGLFPIHRNINLFNASLIKHQDTDHVMLISHCVVFLALHHVSGVFGVSDKDYGPVTKLDVNEAQFSVIYSEQTKLSDGPSTYDACTEGGSKREGVGPRAEIKEDLSRLHTKNSNYYGWSNISKI